MRGATCRSNAGTVCRASWQTWPAAAVSFPPLEFEPLTSSPTRCLPAAHPVRDIYHRSTGAPASSGLFGHCHWEAPLHDFEEAAEAGRPNAPAPTEGDAPRQTALAPRAIAFTRFAPRTRCRRGTDLPAAASTIRKTRASTVRVQRAGVPCAWTRLRPSYRARRRSGVLAGEEPFQHRPLMKGRDLVEILQVYRALVATRYLCRTAGRRRRRRDVALSTRGCAKIPVVQVALVCDAC